MEEEPAERAADAVKTITLRRLTEDTYGQLEAEDATVICVTLEWPWDDNKHDVSRIPAGTYPIFLRPGDMTRHGYDVWELLDVPDRANVQIHIGNKLADTEGCILVGSARYPDSEIQPYVSGSHNAYKKWMAEMKSAESDGALLVVLDPPAAA